MQQLPKVKKNKVYPGPLIPAFASQWELGKSEWERVSRGSNHLGRAPLSTRLPLVRGSQGQQEDGQGEADKDRKASEIVFYSSGLRVHSCFVALDLHRTLIC